MKTEAFRAIQQVFPCELEFLNSIPLTDIVNGFEDEADTCSEPFLIRLAGQSGSGKSSQLLPAVQASIPSNNFMYITVGKFSKFHPKYQFFSEQAPHNVRELTNGFALRALLYFLTYCVQKRVNIILDLTLLDPAVEKYIFSLAKEYSYRCITNIMCTPKRLSDSFIAKRADETGRCVSKKTSFYQFSILPVSLKAIVKYNIFDEEDCLILWSNVSLTPVYVAKHNDSHCLSILNNYRSLRNMTFHDFDAAKNSKTKWLKYFFREM